MIGEVTDPMKAGPFGVVNAGTSVIAMKYKDGVIMAADTAVSYGSMRAIHAFKRISKISDECAFACSGEMADF